MVLNEGNINGKKGNGERNQVIKSTFSSCYASILVIEVSTYTLPVPSPLRSSIWYFTKSLSEVICGAACGSCVSIFCSSNMAFINESLNCLLIRSSLLAFCRWTLAYFDHGGILPYV